MNRLLEWMRPFAFLGRNAITLTGAVLTTSSGVIVAAFLLLAVVAERPMHPYAGILIFLVLPAVFVLGLALMPAGVLLRRHALKRAGTLPHVFPKVDLTEPLLRRAVVLVAVASVVNVAILGASTYRGVEEMESVAFCGTSCHTVMQPEYTAYLGSPHSRVACVQCHIGPGASWFVRSKLDGVRQVVATALGTYSRPIPSPVHELRPARETCEQCHWPQKFTGDQLRVKTRFADDEANTRLYTVLLMRIGGHAGTGGTGIHGRHLAKETRIHYVPADERRESIARVRYLDDAGQTVVYLAQDAKLSSAELEQREERAMDCVDCHNRPTHAFELPGRALDRMLEEGRMDRGLPFAKKKAAELIQAEYPDRDEAARRIVEGFTGFYRKEYPGLFAARGQAVQAGAEAARDAYLRNVFPAMNVTWGTHPNQIGHEDFPGCFRCHDDKHQSADGKTITQDCEACHAVLAMEEAEPKVLAEIGLR